MSIDEIKKLAAKACGHWFNLEVEDMTDSLSVGLTLKTWRPGKKGDNFDVFLSFSALPGFNFESWAHRKWKWDGKFSVYVSWLPPEGEPAVLRDPETYENEYEIEKKPNQRPYVLDCKHGQLWMSTSE